MLPSQVAESYDRIAARWADPSFNPNNGIEQHQRALSFVLSKGKALDVGCGCNGRFVHLLTSNGFALEGLDLSSEMLRIARKAHPHVVYHQADICEWTVPGPYDLITAWDSIWHVPLDKQAAVLLKLCHALAAGGVLIFSAGGVEAPGEIRDEHMGVPMYHASLGVPRICSVLVEGGCALRHFEYDQYPQPHVYVIAQRV